MKIKSRLNFKLLFFIALAVLFSLPTYAQKKNDKFVLILDAGHGGKDPGTRGVVENEKEIALAITLKVGKLIKDYYKNDIKIIYTRDDDTFVELSERADIANRNHADFFISIHCNAGRPSASGTETFVLGSDPKRAGDNFSIVKRENSVILLEDNHKEKYEGFNPNSPESLIGLTLMQNTHLENSLRFAYNVEHNFVHKDNRKSRGVKQAGFVVLWRTATPSVLIETGFISNPEEGRYLASEKGQNATAESIFNAFKVYKEGWDLIRKQSNETSSTRNSQPVSPIAISTEKEKPVTGKLFRIQFLTSKKKYRSTAPQFKGLKDVSSSYSNGVYKYFYGATSFESKRDALLKQVKSKGFPDAFVVEFPTEETPQKEVSQNENKKSGYRIQVLTSGKSYSSNAPQMKGLVIDKIKENNLYKYYYGWYDSEKEANASLQTIRKNKFPDAFVVQFKNGVKQ